jgi:flagellar capping protein FliD
MATSPFQVTGIASGISWDEIISKTIEAASEPATQWQKKIDTLEYKKSLYEELSSAFFKLRNTLTSLRLTSTYKSKVAEFSVSNPPGGNADAIVKATVSTDAEISQWKITVDQIAEKHQQYSARQDDPLTALGISGSFRIRAGAQVATIDIESTDTLMTINQKIASAKDQNGDTMLVTAQVIDNRIVIQGAETGLDNTGYKSAESLVYSDSLAVMIQDPLDSTKQVASSYLTYLPKAANGEYPPTLYSVKAASSTVSGSTQNFLEGRDYIYHSDTGIIEWITQYSPSYSASNPPRRPGEGDELTLIYTLDYAVTRNTNLASPPQTPDSIPAAPSGLPYNGFYESYSITDPTTGRVYRGSGEDPLNPGIPLDPTADFFVFNAASSANPVPCVQWNSSLPVADLPSDANGNQYVLSIVQMSTDTSSTTISSSLFTTTGSTNETINLGDLWATAPSKEELARTRFKIEAGGTVYEEGKDFVVTRNANPSAGLTITWKTATVPPVPVGTTYDVIISGTNVHEIKYESNNNVFYLEEGDPLSPTPLTSASVLVKLGFSNTDGTQNNVTQAQDAVFSLNGISITKSSNTIDDLIANVTLELTGAGTVTMNITQDATKAVEGVQAFVDAYNEVMTWINERLDEKYSSSTADESDDYLQNLLQESKGSTTFGVLHGDQLLWSIKNQLRNMLADPIASLSKGVASKKYLLPAEALNLEGSFYLMVAGQAARINITKKDSLEDIKEKVASATSITSTDGKNISGTALKLSVDIRNGQLVINADSSSTLSSERSDTLIRNQNATGNYDYLPYTPYMETPTNGTFTIQSSSGATYEEGVDYEIKTEEDSGGLLISKIEWIGTKKPASGDSYYVTYSYDPKAVSISMIPGTGDLSTLDLHADQSKTQLSSFGITTTADDYGKSGLLEFDSDVFFESIKSDAQNASDVMTTFFKQIDSYVGYLVDSSQVLVGGTVVTKGRIANAVNSIDSEVTSLNDQITKLTKQLEERQTNMYKQYSDMETAIQKLNAQISSLTQYFTNVSGSS